MLFCWLARMFRNGQRIVSHEQQMGQQRLHELAVGGIVQQRKAQLGISVPGMWACRREGRQRFYLRRMVMRVSMVLEFALEVSRKDGVYGSGVDVTGFSMMGIGFGMDMEERECQQPYDRPSAQHPVESEAVAVGGLLVHMLLSRRYHSEGNTSRSRQETGRTLPCRSPSIQSPATHADLWGQDVRLCACGGFLRVGHLNNDAVHICTFVHRCTLDLKIKSATASVAAHNSMNVAIFS